MSLIYDEIRDQYDAMEQCKLYLDSRFDAVEQLFSHQHPPLVAFLGCGSSFALAKSLSDSFHMCLGRPSYAVPAGDLTLHAARYAKMMEGALLVLLSRSGSTSELLFALDALEEQGCHFTVVSISCVTQGRLAPYSALSLELPWCFDHSICQTRTVSCLYYSVMYLIARLGGDAALLRQMSAFPAQGACFLAQNESRWARLADRPWDHVAVLADAEIHGLAEEGALAFKEICQLPSNCYHVLDARHGPKVLFRSSTLVIAVLTGKKLEYDLMLELAEQGACVVLVTDMPVSIGSTEDFSIGEHTSHILRGLYAIVLCQMLSFYKSKVTGTDPDHPDGLDAWIKL